jgi:predicted PhzF superfamily epimerase YddE/YHI9
MLLTMASYHLLRVFCDDAGRGGNALAVFLDGSQVPPDRRQQVAAELGLSETVFVHDAPRGELRIFTPSVEMPFAGHPTVGAAWLLRELGQPPTQLRVPAGELPVRFDENAAFVAGRPEWAPEFELEQLADAGAVDALDGAPRGHDLISAWAWIDESAGIVRARVFPPRLGIDEDEATGAAAVRLCASLGRPIDIRQGRGSRILARPLGDGLIEIGGRAVLEGERQL